jgi:hypothetical protein
MFGKTLYGDTFKDVNFVPLQSATFCVQCELISANSKPYCLACGSHALLGLSRVLGGSMRNQQTAHLITDVELNNLVRDLLRTVPDPEVVSMADHSRMPSLAIRTQLRVANGAHPVSGFRAVSATDEMEIHPAELDLEPAISAITERAQHLTGATGAAIALRAGDEIVCRARAGRTAPDLGVRPKPMRAFPQKPSAPARSCFVTMRSATLASIWPVAVALESARFSFPLCVTIVAPSVFSKCCRPLRGRLMRATWRPCSFFPA